MIPIIIVDPSRVNMRDLLEGTKRFIPECVIIRAYNPPEPIYFLGKRPSLWAKFLVWWFKKSEGEKG